MPTTITYPTLYKLTSTGATQIWYVEREMDRYRTVSGQIDGKKVTSEWTTAKPKNVGKSNETSGPEQAHLEVEAKIKKKLAQGGYHDSPEAITEAKFFKPMLAKSYDDYPVTDFSAGVYSQPKLDGVRCIAKADGLWTRTGKPIDSVPHISDALAPFFVKFPNAVLDGELYADKFADDFNAIISLVRKQKPTADHFAKTRVGIQYHVYDFPSADGGFRSRYLNLVGILLPMIDDETITLVGTDGVHSQADLDESFAMYVRQGYEGQMVRLDGVPYENKRSKSLLKRKSFKDDEFPIVAIEEGEGNRSGMAGFITYRLPDGRTFGSGIRGSHDWCRELLADAAKYEGGMGTVRFFDYTPDGKPRFPVTVAVYDSARDL